MRFEIKRFPPLRRHLSGVLWATLVFAFLSMSMLQVPTAAQAVGVVQAEELITIDPALLLTPGPGKMGKGALARRAMSLAEHPQVVAQLEYLLTEKRVDILESLALSTRYLDIIVPILEEHGLPPELAYLCIIESGYRQRARSHAGAVGMWQMIRSTSTRFDLKTNSWVDDRLDFVRSTGGASKFVNYLLKRFDNWDQVLAAYNAGEGRVGRAVKRAVREGLSPEMGNLRLPRETRIYVPAFYAALLIALEPERYGLFPDYQPTIDYLEIRVPGGVPLATIADRLGCDTRDLASLNPAILKGRVPVSSGARGGYALRVPCSVGEEKAKTAAAGLNEVRYVSYRVRKGDTLWDISRKFGVSMSSISRTGSRKGSWWKIFPGETLLVALTAGEAG